MSLHTNTPTGEPEERLAGLRHKVLWMGFEPSTYVEATELFWLPADTPFGNLGLKLLKSRVRVGHINERIDEVWEEWTRSSGTSQREPLIIEEIVFSVRQAVDEFVSLRRLLAEYRDTGTFPAKLRVDCIDAELKESDQLVKRHEEFLNFCNGASNAYKHSFLQSDLALTGVDEPCVFALRHARNNLHSAREFYSASLNSFIAFFSTFLSEYSDEIRTLASRIRDR